MNKLFTKIAGLTLGLAMAIGVGVAVKGNSEAVPAKAAVNSTLTFTAACGGSGTADDEVVWTVSSDGTESTFDKDKGIHYGTGSASVGYIQLATSGISGTVTKVVVNASTASGVSATASVTVGGDAFGGDPQSLTASAANYTFTGSATAGEIVVRIAKPSKATKAIYCKSIVVTYDEQGGGTATYSTQSISIEGSISGIYDTNSDTFDNSGFTVKKVIVNDDDPSDTKEETVTSGITYHWEYSNDSSSVSLPISTAATYPVQIWASVNGETINTKNNPTESLQYVKGNLVISTPASIATWDLKVKSYTVTSVDNEAVVTWTNNFATMVNRTGDSETSADNYLGGDDNERTSSRFYGGNAWSLTPKSGVEISKVVLTATSDSYATAFKNSTFTNGTATSNGSTVTVIPTNGKNEISTSVNGTCGFTAVDVYYYAKELTEVTWEGTPVSPQYVGDPFDYTGLTFTAHFSDSTTAPVLGSDINWDALTAGHNPTGSYNGEGVSISGVSVINNILESISISGEMTKTQYKAGGTWDPSGLIVTATFSKGPVVVTDVVWSYSPEAPDEDTESVVVTATYTSGSVVEEASTDPIPVTIQETEGLLKSGYYYITVTNDNQYYFPQGTYSAGGAANNPSATAYNSSVYGKAYYFNLVADNTYTISWTDGESTYYLNAINNNSGAKVSTVESVGATCYWVYFLGEDNAYHLKGNDGTQDRYLAVYNSTDWRTYKQLETSNSNDDLVIISENDKFATDFKNSYTASCNASTGTYTNLDWTTAKAHFNSLHDSTEFVNAEYTVSGSGAQTVVTKKGDTRQLVAEAVAKYDYIVTKYNTATKTVFEEFMERVEAGKISYDSYPVSPLGMSDGNNVMIAIIVIVSLVSLTAIAGFVILRKRKEQ